MFDNLYVDIGSKIKGMAKCTFIVEAIGSIIAGIALAFDQDFSCILIAIIGPIVAWVSSWILYAFGELVEDVHAMRNKIYPIGNAQQTKPVLESTVEQISNFVKKHNNQTDDSPKDNVITQAEDEQQKSQAVFYIIGKDISAGRYTIFSTNPQGGMVYIHSLDNDFLDRRYIKAKEKISLKSGTKIKLINCEISFE